MTEMAADMQGTEDDDARKEIYTFTAPWPIYSMGWCNRGLGRSKFRIAIGSFKEEYSNEIEVIQIAQDSNNGSIDRNSSSFQSYGRLDHPYPATKIAFAPESFQNTNPENDLIATTGDYLRLWTMNESKPGAVVKSVLNNNRHSEYCAPVTSFDWNEVEPSMIGACSIDTTVTIWDITKETAKTQLIAHDKEVYDIAFTMDPSLFSTVGADGSLRMFDLRSLEHSTIVYEAPGGASLLRVAWNKLDSRFIATTMAESCSTIILDFRMPSLTYAELHGHTNFVNNIAWAPMSPSHICTAGDDHQAFIWDIQAVHSGSQDPMLAYSAEGHINQIQWSKAHEDYIAIAYDNKMQFLKV